MFSRLPGAIARSILVVFLVALPTAILSPGSPDNAMLVTLIAIFAGFFTFIEYSAISPSIVEFRQAPPFNRLRFISLFLTILILTLLARDVGTSSPIMRLFEALARQLGEATDFPFSPVRLLVLMLPPDTNAEVLRNIQAAGGVSYMISLTSIAIFVIMLRLKRWPKRYGTFNVWVNLPRFDPTAGGDVVARLNRDSAVNLILGFLLPFLIPAIVKIIVLLGGSIYIDDPQTMVWTVTAWAFLPASMLMRGVALSRVAGLIHRERKRAYQRALEDGLLPA